MGVSGLKNWLVAALLVSTPVAIAVAQVLAGAPLEEQLEYLFPGASSFSDKQGSPPHYRAFADSEASSEPELIGLAFWTTELDPLERGYDGPIKMFVGMEPDGRLRGVILTEHYEPYGDFSIERPEFAAQFENKDIRNRFRVGEDIDAVSRATITVRSASRAVRNSSRRIARAYLTPPSQ